MNRFFTCMSLCLFGRSNKTKSQVEPKQRPNLEVLPTTSITQVGMRNTVITKTGHTNYYWRLFNSRTKPEVPLARTKEMSIVQIDKNGCLLDNGEKINTSPKHYKAEIALNLYCGAYAYVLAKSSDGKQYLLLKPFKKFQSEHNAFKIFFKNIVSYAKSDVRMIAGGEIILVCGKILSWNLKSKAYSQGTSLDENVARTNSYNQMVFEAAKQELYLPQEQYISIANWENLHDNFSAGGSVMNYR